MKKLILSLGFIVFSVVGIFAQGEDGSVTPSMDPNAPKFKFETETIDYGTIEYNSNGDREFKFTNVGKQPLIISDAKGSCQCTVPIWPTEPIMPGKTAIIKVHYNTSNIGAFEKSITITSNADTPVKVLIIKGVVDPKKEE